MSTSRSGGRGGYRWAGLVLLEAEAGRLHAWLDGVRVLPRFRTPLEKRPATSPT